MYHDYLISLEEYIIDGLNRLINNYKENASYAVYKESGFSKHERYEVFCKLLDKILFENKTTIHVDYINETIKKCNYDLSEKAFSRIREDVIRVLLLSGIITGRKSNNMYPIITITDREYRMNSITKINAIKDILGPISKIKEEKDISITNKKLIMDIFNFSK
ncbi:hypothetical protein [Aliarcobacter cryaerophilus]|uniref:Uncharacterized protein n=1 Tax=Aliarcobacter cryaerophilus TaxID=28198 RepID=A0A2S9TK95_9BACT|nr:hypothetical protein [Aliarcobacter cryaerophilus]PRM99217.1 hypothetical protein CJ670_02490 [Arcobacter cryaerophilus gv. crypticus]